MKQKDNNQKMLESMTRSLEIVVKQNQELIRENAKLIEFIMEHGSFTFKNSAAVNPNTGDEMTGHRTANYGENEHKNKTKVKEWRYKLFEENISLMSMLVTIICFLLDSMDKKEVYFFIFLMLIFVIIFARLKNGLKQYPLR